jgi:hypothetical protein
MYAVIININADSFLQTAKMNHVVWILDVYKVMFGMSDKAAADFSDHRCVGYESGFTKEKEQKITPVKVPSSK